MNTTEELQGKNERILSKLGGGYILRVLTNSQLISSFLGPLAGLYFIFITAGMNNIQFIQLILSLVLFMLLVDLLHYAYIRLATNRARLSLDHIYKNKTLPEGFDNISAWNEIITLPQRSAIVQFIQSYILIILPVCLFMYFIGRADWKQLFIISIGGSLSVLSTLVQSVLYLDARLAPVRHALMPAERSAHDFRPWLGQQTRLYFVTLILILALISMVGLLGYVNLQAIAIYHVDPTFTLERFQIQFITIGLIGVALSIFLLSRLAQSIVKPSREIINVLDLITKGRSSERAWIYSTDESAQLTQRLNKLLDELQLMQDSFERQVQERTASLELRNSQLQTAAYVAREAASYQNLDDLLTQVVDLISNRFNFYHTGIFLVDDRGEYAILRAASSEGGQNMLARGYKLEIGHQGIVGTAIYDNSPKIAQDTGSETSIQGNPDLPLTRSEAVIPLSIQNKVIGVLDLQSSEPSTFTKENIGIYQTMADQIALAIQNSRLANDSLIAYRQIETMNAESVRKSWIERTRQQKRAFQYLAGAVSQISQTDNEQHFPESIELDQFSGRMTIPINLRGQKIGRIILNRKSESPWGDTERSLALEIANQIGLALENARLLEETQRRAAQEQSLNDLTSRLSRSLDPDTILQTTVRELHQLPNVTEVSVYITQPKTSPDNSSQDT